MSRHLLNERVGAILGTKDKVIEFLGYGVYEGDFDPNDPTYNPSPVGCTADMAREAHKIAREAGYEYRMLNPRIKLDSGKIVWGCECWWGNEEQIKKQIEQYKSAGYTIKEVDIDEIRKQSS